MKSLTPSLGRVWGSLPLGPKIFVEIIDRVYQRDFSPSQERRGPGYYFILGPTK